MDRINRKQGASLYSLIPLEDFKALLGLDDRDDRLARFCLVTTTYTIESYCKRRLSLKKSTEQAAMNNEDPVSYLREYPVREVLGVWGPRNKGLGNREWGTGEELVEPDFYRFEPVGGDCEDIPCCLRVSPALFRGGATATVKVMYRAGYAPGKVPPDLASACLELAGWSFARYRGRLVGVGGNPAGQGLETAMPENVRLLLEPYKRRLI